MPFCFVFGFVVYCLTVVWLCFLCVGCYFLFDFVFAIARLFMFGWVVVYGVCYCLVCFLCYLILRGFVVWLFCWCYGCCLFVVLLCFTVSDICWLGVLWVGVLV